MRFESQATLKVLVFIIIVLLTLHLMHIWIYFQWGVYYPIFDMNQESNLPTLTSTLILLLCSVFLYRTGQRVRSAAEPAWGYWIGLAVIFVFLAMDEQFMIHDRLSGPVRTTLNTSGPLYFAWVIPYAALLLGFLAVYLRFLLLLPRRTRILFVLSGAIFVGGALGMEIVGASIRETEGRWHPFYLLTTTIEELMEFSGASLFLFSILDYRERYQRLAERRLGYSPALHEEGQRLSRRHPV